MQSLVLLERCNQTFTSIFHYTFRGGAAPHFPGSSQTRCPWCLITKFRQELKKIAACLRTTRVQVWEELPGQHFAQLFAWRHLGHCLTDWDVSGNHLRLPHCLHRRGPMILAGTCCKGLWRRWIWTDGRTDICCVIKDIDLPWHTVLAVAVDTKIHCQTQLNYATNSRIFLVKSFFQFIMS